MYPFLIIFVLEKTAVFLMGSCLRTEVFLIHAVSLKTESGLFLLQCCVKLKTLEFWPSTFDSLSLVMRLCSVWWWDVTSLCKLTAFHLNYSKVFRRTFSQIGEAPPIFSPKRLSKMLILFSAFNLISSKRSFFFLFWYHFLFQLFLGCPVAAGNSKGAMIFHEMVKNQQILIKT